MDPKTNEEQIAFLTKENDTLKKFVKESDTKMQELESELESYRAFISKDEFDATIEALESGAEFSALGTVESVSESLTKLEKYEDAATLEEVDTAIATIESYSAAGTVEEVAKAVESVKALEDAGMAVETLIADVETKALEVRESAIQDMSSKFNVSAELMADTLALHEGDLEKTESYLSKFKAVESADTSATVDAVVGATVVESVGTDGKVASESAPTKPSTMLSQF